MEFARHRKLSMFSVFILTLQAIAALVALIGSTDPKVLILKDSCMTGALGLVFLGSCAVGKPVTYYLGQKFATDGSPEGAGEWDRMWREYPTFRRTQRIVGLVWGVAYLVEAAIRVVAVYTLPFDVAFNVGAVLPLLVTGLVIAWTFWYGARARRLGEARTAAARQAAAGRA